jgi:hypothetical protein
MRRSTAKTGRGLAVSALAVCAACTGLAETPRRLPAGYVLIQKDQFQALYDGGGRIERLLQDRNHDGRAEAVILYYPNGKPRLGELDTDGDGRVDRWEYFRRDGSLERVGVSRAQDGRPDVWEDASPSP